jgi:hypothetical protein
MKEWKIPVVWQSWGLYSVEANSLKEAIDKVKSYDFALPERQEYIDDSMVIDYDENINAIRETWNHNQEDCE